MGHPATVLEGRVVVITGAARGIGRALAERLLAAGARVVLSDRDDEALGCTHKELAQGRSVAVTADVTSGASMAYLAAEAERRLGPIDVWINNAGLARHRAIADYAEDEIDSMLAVNLKGTILGSQAALRTMAPRRRGHIVNIVSTAALRGIPSETVYCATKWGVRGFTQGLREEAAPSNIRVSAVLPGGVDTAFWEHALPGQVMPLDTFLQPSQVADAVVALLTMDEGDRRYLLDCTVNGGQASEWGGTATAKQSFKVLRPDGAVVQETFVARAGGHVACVVEVQDTSWYGFMLMSPNSWTFWSCEVTRLLKRVATLAGLQPGPQAQAPARRP
jgi:NAD(P)-dependent dehydrogenase (short-subunit alcohol dehydrogenase family)